jgi:FG-GAP repeat
LISIKNACFKSTICKNSSIQTDKNKNRAQSKKKSNFHFGFSFKPTLNYLILIFTVFSVILPIGTQPILQTNLAFAQSDLSSRSSDSKLQINSTDPFDFSTNNIKKASENIIIPDIVGPDNESDTGSNSNTSSKSQSQSQSIAQPAYSAYHDNTTANGNPHNDEIIETDDKPGTELTFTDSQTDTPNSNNIINNYTNEESNEEVIEVEDQSSSIQSESGSTTSPQSQSQSDAQPKYYNSYRDYMEKNNQNASAETNVTSENKGVESSTSDSNIDTGNSSTNIDKNANNVNIIVPKDRSTTEDKSSTELSSSSTASPELSAQSSHKIYGDFNGDGFDDLAIGVPLEDVNTGAGIIDDAGAVNVLYGSSNGLSAASPPRPDQFWTQSTPDVNDVSEAGDLFGDSLSSGDFNGDGFDDLAIGVPSEDVDTGTGTIANAGAVNVLYGSSNGLSATSLRPDQIWTQSSTDVNDVSEADDLFGASVSSGDFNGDGINDIVIGVPFETGIIDDAGAVNVLYGSSNGLSATSPRPDQFWTQSTPDVNDVSEAGDLFGDSLSSGDFNGDGFDDLAIGTPFEDIDTGAGTIDDAGAVNVLYGSSSGLSATSPPRPDQIWTQSTPDVNDVSEAGDLFGDSLSSGDFNGDGFDDLAIGVPFEDVVVGQSEVLGAGAVNVLYSSSNGLSATSPPRPDQIWTQSTADVNDISEPDDNFASALS